MTDYQISKNRKDFKKRSNKWQGMFAFFIVAFMLVVLFYGAGRSIFSKKDTLRSSGWDNVSSFILGLRDNQNSLFIFQKDPKRAVLVKTGFLGSGLSADVFSKEASVVFGADVKNYMNIGNLSDLEIEKKFDNFIGLATPIKILTTGLVSDELKTNVSRLDALKLWWQLKDIRSKDLQFVNLSSFKTKEQGKSEDKVLGITSDFINSEISKYLENTKIIEENIDLRIVNSTEDDRASFLAENFITAVGGRVVSVTGDVSTRNNCNITTNVKTSYTVRYLAKAFICDINDAPQMDDNPSVTLYLGQDFPERYF